MAANGLSSGRRARPLREVWSEKDNVGVQDFVMLENFRDEQSFIKNMRDRFLLGKLIYVSPSYYIVY